ncbi:cobalt-precorrin-6A reductase [Methylosinus sp. Sm6]|uniref:cobalt-precorrin-6A reductase n=1 Tax=Methylosinus sp. Sm6 TaxID=2866948 RepID=UPI001C991588|nr:cobalt-precorrin-6A reductase [Methylosinus sp. Sm6]MBY6241071.1 cobalt-precorrin-6A reductase [Methylosinus sp. Sm6]
MRILLLGGTAEAGAIATALAAAGLDAVYSYAGRTASPKAQPLPTRIGGFGGADGLAAYLRTERITHVVDATHPFAAGISRNAAAAAAASGVDLIAVERPAWTPVAGDRWIEVPSIEAAVAALPEARASVFLAIGRQSLGAFAVKPQHSYLLRLVDPMEILPLPDAIAVVDRGPFTESGDRALMERHGVALVVAKNAGGVAAAAKLSAARALGLPVVMIGRPAVPPRKVAPDVASLMEALRHGADLGV